VRRYQQRVEITSAASEIAQRYDGIDGLINNAGIENPGFFLSTDPASWETLVRVNLFGVLNCTYVVAPLIFERSQDSGYGRIVNIASEAARSGALGESARSAGWVRSCHRMPRSSCSLCPSM
jgi:2-hydroxycyclohexanecarboxyl-CoA dehydrogenase